MKPAFGKDGFSLNPCFLDAENWFYEGKTGLSLVTHHHDSRVIIEIPWRKLEPAVKRYQAYQRKRRRQRGKKT